MTDLPEFQLPTGERVQVTGPLVIGRGGDADLVLDDSEASRRHAQVVLDGDACLLNDLESRNGTTVNGERVTGPRTLRDGDVVRIGQTSLLFRHPTAEPEAPAAVADDPVATIVAPRVQPTVRQHVAASSPMQVLGRITRAIAGMDDAREIADTVTTALKDEYGCEGASLVLAEPGGASLYFASVASDSPSLKLITLKPGQGIVGRSIEQAQPVLVADVATDSGHAAGIDRSLGFTSRSIVAAPVLAPDGSVLGAIEAINPLRKPAFDADDLEFLALVATQLGPALARARSWEGIERERAALARVSGIRREFIATAPAMIRLVMEAAALHEARTPIYLSGEPGTGKRLLSWLVHEASGAGSQLVAAGVAEALAAPAAASVHLTGLDQMPIADQEQLAVLARESAGKRSIFVSGHGSLLSLLSSGHLSPALHDALEAGQLVLPPLRARQEEFEPLVDHFIEMTCARLGRAPFVFSEDAFARLRAYAWPGNIGELRAVVHRAGVLARDTNIELAALLSFAPELTGPAPEAAAAGPGPIARRKAEQLARAYESIRSDSAEERESGVPVLAREPGPAATDALVALLDDPTNEVRSAAAAALGRRPEAAAALALRLETEVDLDVATGLLEALAATGQAAQHSIVVRALRAGDPQMRRLAMRTLRLAGDAREAAESVREDPSAAVRVEALAALFQAGEPVEPELVELSGTGEPAERAEACATLGELGLAQERLLELTANGDRMVRVAAVRALGQSRSAEAKSILLELLEDVTISGEAAAALGRMGVVEAAPRLAALAVAPEAPIAARRAVVHALGGLPGPASVAGVGTALTDPDLAEAATEAAQMLGDPELEDGVIGVLQSGGPVVPLAIEVLGAIGTARSVEPLLEAGGQSADVALESLEALSSIAARSEDKAALVEAALPALEHDESRHLALEFLAELDHPAAVTAFLAHRDDSDFARAALGRLGPRAVPGLLAALEGPHQGPAAEELAALGPQVVAGLLPLLRDRALARAASRAVLEIGPAALPALVTAVDSAGPEELPVLLQLLGQASPGRLAAYVATFLSAEEPSTRYAAIIALGNLPDARSETELLARMNSADPAESTLATLALGRIQSADGFETLAARVGEGDRRTQYALAGAISEYNLRQAPVLAMVNRMVREGLPFSSAALEAGFQAGAVSNDDVLTALQGSSIPESQKLRLITAIGRLPSALALGPLLAVVRADVPEPLVATAVAAISRHEVEATEAIAAMLLDPAMRSRGIRLLAVVHDARSLMGVLRLITPALDHDPDLRSALHSMGDLVMGPLIDVISQNWDLESLGLLWRLTEVVEEPDS